MSVCLCHGRGLIRIAYESGEPFDLALCQCANGQRLRGQHETHPEWLPTALRLAPETRIAWIEDFSTSPAEVAAWGIQAGAASLQRDFIEAGKVGKRARL